MRGCRGLEPVPAHIRQHPPAHIRISRRFEVCKSLILHVSNSRRKPEHPDETHTAAWRARKVHTERPPPADGFKPTNLWLVTLLSTEPPPRSQKIPEQSKTVQLRTIEKIFPFVSFKPLQQTIRRFDCSCFHYCNPLTSC